MKTKDIFALTAAIGLSLLTTSVQANQENPSYQDVELENVKQQMLLIEKAERTGDPVLVAQADKVKADLIMQEAKGSAKNPISMEDKIIVIEQAKVSDSSDIKEVAETIKQDLLLDENSDHNTDKAEIRIMTNSGDKKELRWLENALFWLSGALTGAILVSMRR